MWKTKCFLFTSALAVLSLGQPGRAEEVPTPADVAAAKVSGIPIMSNTIADIAQSVAPAVVNIEVVQSRKQAQLPPGMDFPMPLPFGKYEYFFNGQRIEPPRESHNTGSGFIVRSDGYIVTNAHVVRGANKIKVTLNDKRVLDGTVVGTDGFSDIAVVKIDSNQLPVANMGSSNKVRPGEFAIAIGSPLGFDHTVTFGIISAVGRTITDVNGNINFIQSDVAINPGNSGGPLLNLNGEVIGVNTAIQANAQNIGFSIPIDIAKSVANDLIEHKTIQRPWLGIAMQVIDEAMSKAHGLAANKGVLIGKVIEGSPAKSSGLQPADVIEKIDGQEVSTPKAVQDIVKAHKVSDIIHFLVLRNGAVTAIPVTIGQYPDKPVTGRDYDN
ncbi:MAG: trypsin-like peptidase domain-containing protein [Cyanobacteria bacterium SZAS LIN-5]|nr:trypsin-like peptidase domain-containing protein [Cyanobacteria bacterium SZAS LIN-5]